MATDRAAQDADRAAQDDDRAAQDDAQDPAAPPAASFIVVEDVDGVVGAFESLAKALEILDPFAGVPFVFSRWAGAGSDVWFLPYRDNGAVAFASTDRDAVAEKQSVLLAVNHVEPDNVDYWPATMNELTGPARVRLEGFAQTIASAKESAADVRDGAKSLDDEAVALFLEAAGGRPKPLDESRIDISVLVERHTLDADAVRMPLDFVVPPPGQDSATWRRVMHYHGKNAAAVSGGDDAAGDDAAGGAGGGKDASSGGGPADATAEVDTA